VYLIGSGSPDRITECDPQIVELADITSWFLIGQAAACLFMAGSASPDLMATVISRADKLRYQSELPDF
jgi:hypothetical protein